ncbi:MAG: hypothetical protein ACPGWR_07570, partial [Ardenticatenaceae bacterium]
LSYSLSRRIISSFCPSGGWFTPTRKRFGGNILTIKQRSNSIFQATRFCSDAGIFRDVSVTKNSHVTAKARQGFGWWIGGLVGWWVGDQR